jgi:hypothetical protein
MPGRCPFPYRCPRAKLWAVGRRAEGGVAALHDEGHVVDDLELAPLLFDLLGVLIEAAQAADAPSGWGPTGFVAIDELCRRLSRLWGATEDEPPWIDADRLYKAVSRLRRVLADGLFGPGAGREWSFRLLEQGPLGYRISAPAEGLALCWLDDPA